MRDETSLALGRRLSEEQSSSRLPSVAAGLVRGERRVWFGAAGETQGARPTDETQYRCGSVSKTFVAAAVMRLRDEGIVDLSDPVSAHLPVLDWSAVTVAHLLSHTSGLRSETAGPFWERTPGSSFAELVDTSLRDEDFLFRPGRRFHYSNVGYAVLGELVKQLKGADSLLDVVDDELLRPLGMLRTTTRPVAPFAAGYAVHPHADVVLAEPEHDSVAMAPAGQLWSTVDDLCRWTTVLSGGRPDVLSPATAAEMREPVAIEDEPGLAWTAAYGLGIELINRAGRRHYGHHGSMPGFQAVLMTDAATTDSVVILSNATSFLSRQLEEDLLRTLAEGEPLPSAPWRPTEGGIPAELLELTGTWYWGTLAFALSIRHDGLLELSSSGGDPATQFGQAARGEFVGLSGPHVGETLRPVRHSDGSLSHLDVGSWVFTRAPYDRDADVPGGVDPAGWVGGPSERHGHRPFPWRHA